MRPCICRLQRLKGASRQCCLALCSVAGLLKMLQRPRNTATSEQVAAVLKGSLKGLFPEKYLQLDLDLVVEEYVETMLLVLKVTRRPIASVLIAAASLAFEVSPQEATAFGQRLTAAFANCHQKKKSCTSGKKLSPAVYRVVCALGGRSSSPQHSLASSSRQDLTSPSDHSHSSATPRSRARTPTTRAEILKMYQAESHTASRELPALVDTRRFSISPPRRTFRQWLLAAPPLLQHRQEIIMCSTWTL